MSTATAPTTNQSTATNVMSTVTPTKTSTIFTAPTWVKSFYSKFPLVVLEQEDELDWKVRARDLPDQAVELWIHPSSSTYHQSSPHRKHRSWTSSSPTSLRTQLLFLLRETPKAVPISFREWTNESSAPGGTLPALHIPGQGRVLPTDEIRGWLEGTYPLKGKGKELQGLPNQEAYDRALSLSQLILGNLYPAYLASLPVASTSNFSSSLGTWSGLSTDKVKSQIHLLFPNPPPLLAGLTTPLPASLTGDARDIDFDELVRKGVEALEALGVVLHSQDDASVGRWALDAKHPTSLDALVASHIYGIYDLPEQSSLRRSLESNPALGEYVDRVLDFAEGRMRQ